MRTFLIITFIIAGSVHASAQYSGFQTLKNKFNGKENVFSLSTSGFFARGVLLLAGERDFKKAIKNIHRISLITIPKTEFDAQKLTVDGFKKFLETGTYEFLASTLDHGDEVSLYIQSGENKRNGKYFILVDNQHEVVAIEIKGYIDPQLMLKDSYLSYANQ